MHPVIFSSSQVWQKFSTASRLVTLALTFLPPLGQGKGLRLVHPDEDDELEPEDEDGLARGAEIEGEFFFCIEIARNEGPT